MGLGAVAFEAAGNLSSYANGRSIKGPGWRPWPDVGLAQEQQPSGAAQGGAWPARGRRRQRTTGAEEVEEEEG